ncbi:hypothetical protein C0Z18_03400 [Trinickia dabaoshanensis]|uniref:Uncharacterized protein n=1 Tax=Trinickia dabaoshanensis TaxID=564714 RepID=A0A2N7W1K6_9BURK|nr:hypothetical protein C0Z18_03400 [Trinickia dabaoshanensis]
MVETRKRLRIALPLHPCVASTMPTLHASLMRRRSSHSLDVACALDDRISPACIVARDRSFIRFLPQKADAQTSATVDFDAVFRAPKV